MILLSFLGPLKQYDLIHVTSPPDFLVFSAIMPKLFGAKVILDIHDIGPELYMRKLGKSKKSFIIKMLKFIEKISCQFADHVITVTDIWKEKLIKRSVQSTKCSSILNVPDDDMFRPVIQKRKDLSKSFNLFYHGSLEEHFGVDTLLKAIPEVRQNIPDVELHIYGGGRLLEEFEILSTKLEIQDCVIFHGVVPFYELPKILMEADIGIVPTKASVFSDEALSMKSLEYISLKIPIVISKNTAHSYYYDDSVVKFFKPDDEHDLAKSIILLCKNENERNQLASNAYKLIGKYGWKKAKLKYLQIIDNLIS
jgi:glycosyltransferase involved in cell wall biosynthesis